MPTLSSTLYRPTTTGLEALDELDEVSWKELEHAYGTGITGDGLHDDVSGSLYELTNDPDKACRALYANICHQGMTVYAATCAAVPFLAAVAAGEIDSFEVTDKRIRAELVILLGYIARASSQTTEDGSCAGALGADVAEQIRSALLGSAEHLHMAVAHDDTLRDLVNGIAGVARRPDGASVGKLGHAIDGMVALTKSRRQAFIAATHERENNKRQTLARLEVGAVELGRVRAVAEYGAFIDIGGVDALLHVLDLDGRDPYSFEPGAEVRVVVIELDRDKERVRVGLRVHTIG